MMTTMEIIKSAVGGQPSAVSRMKTARRFFAAKIVQEKFDFHRTTGELSENPKSEIRNLKSQNGMSLIAVLAVMTIFAIGLLAIAPTVQQGVQRELELESIRRGEEIAEAIKQYVVFYRGAKLPRSMDDLLEGLPQGTKKRQILRQSAAIDPLSEDGKWRLVKPDSPAFINFGKRVQLYNNGLLPPSNPRQYFDRYAIALTNIVNTKSESDTEEADDSEIEIVTADTPFIGVASQSRSRSVLTYYGIENHSKWIFTPLFRGSGTSDGGGRRRDRDGTNSNRRGIP
ncbi:MAG TPA: type II secretion system protein [Pyrinomonadaceae bacterium]|nr:type II secretion system protein [Pyrinomonadaceae bacterium]